MSRGSTASKVRVQFVNSNEQPTVFVTQTNTMTLRLVNQTGADVMIAPSAPQNSPPPGGAFQFLIDLSSFYAAAGDQSAVHVSRAGWTPKFFAVQFASWSLAATESLVWADGSPLEFTVASLEPTVPVGTYYLNVSLYNLDGLPPIPVSVIVGVANPPDGTKKDLARSAAIQLTAAEAAPGAPASDPGLVTITKNPNEPVANRLTLQLYNLDPDAPLVPDDVPWGTQPPQFILSFVYDVAPPGYFALTTPGDANAFEVGLRESSGWQPPSKLPAGPQWLLAPDTTNHAILGFGAEAFVEFSIDNVMTQFSPGPTLLYLQYSNIPGYNDGFLTAIIDKEYAQMVITSFAINQSVFDVSDGEIAYGYLAWEVANSVMVDLSGVGPVPSKQPAYQVPIRKDTSFVLTAYDTVLGTILTACANVRVDPAMSSRWLPCGAILLWSGDPAGIPSGFALCDGTKGTPDLCDRFVVGAGGSETPNESGEPHHTHALTGFNASFSTSDAPSHTHLFPSAWYARGLSSGKRSGIDTRGWYDTKAVVEPAGAHDHTVRAKFGSVPTDLNTGGLRPKWYALCYIMKVCPP